MPTSSRLLVSRLPSLTIDPGGGGSALLRAFGLGFLEPLVGAPRFRGGVGGGGEETDHLRPLLRVGTAAYMYLTFAAVCVIAYLTVAFFWCGTEFEQLLKVEPASNRSGQWTVGSLVQQLNMAPQPTGPTQAAGESVVVYLLFALELWLVAVAVLKRRYWPEAEETRDGDTLYMAFEAAR